MSLQHLGMYIGFLIYAVLTHSSVVEAPRPTFIGRTIDAINPKGQ